MKKILQTISGFFQKLLWRFSQGKVVIFRVKLPLSKSIRAGKYGIVDSAFEANPLWLSMPEGMWGIDDTGNDKEPEIRVIYDDQVLEVEGVIKFINKLGIEVELKEEK